MSDPMRATAERLAREVHDKHAQYGGMLPLEHCDKDVSERSIALALAGLTHRDRTAEREAASKAWDAAREWSHPRPPMGVLDWNEARDRYLAAEFDAGERVTLSWGVMARDAKGQYCVWSSWPVDRATALLSVTDSPWHHVRCFEDAEAIKRFLAEQRGAER